MSADKKICCTQLKNEELELIEKYFISNARKGFVKCKDFLLSNLFQTKMNDILDLNIRDDDVWICSFPKSGTTWTQEIVWCIANDFNFEKCKISLAERYTFLDACFLFDAENHGEKNPKLEWLKNLVNTIDKLENQSSRRFIKSHLPYEFLPTKLRAGSKNAKIIYVMRNPKDVSISYFHHRKLYGGFAGDLDEFCDLFIKELVPCAPYWKHVLSYWNQRQNKNVLIIKYEDMKQNLSSVVNKIAEFLGKNVNENQLRVLCEHVSFENMKNNPAVNTDPLTELAKLINEVNDNSGAFIRSGNANQWKKELNQSIIDRFDKLEIENLKDLSVTYATL